MNERHVRTLGTVSPEYQKLLDKAVGEKDTIKNVLDDLFERREVTPKLLEALEKLKDEVEKIEGSVYGDPSAKLRGQIQEALGDIKTEEE